MSTDFDTVLDVMHRAEGHQGLKAGSAALDRIEASHSALVARLNAAVAALEAILTQNRSGGFLCPHERDQAEAAIALAKGGSK